MARGRRREAARGREGGGCCGRPVQGRGREEEGEGIGRMRQGRLAALWEDERERWARSLAARVRESAGWASVQMGLGPNGAAGCWTLSSLTL